MPGNLESIRFTINNVREGAQTIRLNDLSSVFDEETLTADRSVLNFFELAVNQYPLMNKEEFLSIGGSTAYSMKGESHGLPYKGLDSGGTKYLASGIRKSALLIQGVATKEEKAAESESEQGN